MRRLRIDLDRVTRNKDKAAEIKARLKAENEELAIEVREGSLFARCGRDMTVFTCLLKRMDTEGFVEDVLIEAAYADALEEAKAYPVVTPEPKIEDLRLELLHRPGPALAALLERDQFVCYSSEPGGAIVYYGRGVLAEYRPHLQAPEAVAVSSYAGAVVHGRSSIAAKISVTKRAGDGTTPTRPGNTLSNGDGETALIRSEGPHLPAFRIDKLLGKPLLADKLVSLIAEYGAMDKPAVIKRLKTEAGQSRIRAKTEDALGEELDALVKAERLHIDDEGRYLPLAAAGTLDARMDADATGGSYSVSRSADAAETGEPSPAHAAARSSFEAESQVDEFGQASRPSGNTDPRPPGHQDQVPGLGGQPGTGNGFLLPDEKRVADVS
jgi:hypothetical protein